MNMKNKGQAQLLPLILTPVGIAILIGILILLVPVSEIIVIEIQDRDVDVSLEKTPLLSYLTAPEFFISAEYPPHTTKYKIRTGIDYGFNNYIYQSGEIDSSKVKIKIKYLIFPLFFNINDDKILIEIVSKGIHKEINLIEINKNSQ